MMEILGGNSTTSYQQFLALKVTNPFNSHNFLPKTLISAHTIIMSRFFKSIDE